MNVAGVIQKKTAVMMILLALVAALALSVLAQKKKCVLTDDYGNCIMWELVEERPDLSDLLGG